MKPQRLVLALAAVGLCCLVGCNRRPVCELPTPSSPETTLSVADMEVLAGQLSDEILAHHFEPKGDGAPLVLGISSFRNETSDPNVPMGSLIDNVLDKLSASGKFVVLAPYAADTLPKPGTARPSPDYTLDGSITQNILRQGNKQQSMFYVRIRLADNSRGIVACVVQSQIIKAKNCDVGQ